MADSYSVKAILSATDKGFCSTLQRAIGSVKSLASGAVFGVMTGVGMAAFNALTTGASNLVGEINSSSKAWKTFAGNMQIMGQTEAQINSVRSSLQKFAEQSIYSSSDMASTYAQLAAVGTQSAAELVTGFGGLAAAAESPTQAMKTLSQQATQMAAKPKIQWMDFKLMLEQTPAGMAAVAKQMEKTSAELVADIQAGKVATEDFFTAVREVGNSKSFRRLATSYKSVDEAMNGLTETMGNKLTPAFDVLSTVGISAISGIIDKVGQINADSIAKKVSTTVRRVKGYLNVMKTSFSGVGTSVKNALWAIGDALGLTNIKFSHTGTIARFRDIMSSVAEAIKKVSDYIQENAHKLQPYAEMFSSFGQAISGMISAVIPYAIQFGKAISDFVLNNSGQISSVLQVAIPAVLGLVAAFKGFNLIKAAIPGVKKFVGLFGSLAKSGIGNLAARLFKVSTSTNKVGKSSGASAKKLLTLGKTFALIGVGVLMVAGAFALLAQSAVALSSAGGVAIGVFAGMAIGVGALMIGMMAMISKVKGGKEKLNALAAALFAVGAAVLMVGAGFSLMAQASIALANAGGLAIGVFVGMVAAVALLAIGAAALGGALTAGAFGFIAFGAAILFVGTGAVLAAVGIKMLAAVLPTVAAYGQLGASALIALSGGMTVFSVGAILAGAASVVLGAGLIVLAVGAALAGAAMILAGAGASLAASGLTALAGVLPAIAASSVQGEAALTVLGAAMLVFGAGALVAGVAVLAMGAGMTLLAASTAIAAAGFAMIGAAIQTIITGGVAASLALTQMSAPLLAFTPAAMAAGAAAIVLGTGFTTAAVGGLLLSAAVLTLGAGITVLGVGAMVASVGLGMLSGVLPGLAANADQNANALITLSAGLLAFSPGALAAGASAIVLAAGLVSVGVGIAAVAVGAAALAVAVFAISVAALAAAGAISVLPAALSKAASSAMASGKKTGQGYTRGLQSGLKQAPTAASASVNQVSAALQPAVGAARSIGSYIGQGLAAGMLSELGRVRAAAAQLALAAEKAIRLAAQIHSPSKVSRGLGRFWGKAYGLGILDMVKYAWNAAEKLVSVPNIRTPRLAMAYAGEMSADYSYFQHHEYVIEVPLIVDGREVARATAPYTQEELDKRQTRDSRKRGKR